MIVLSLAVVILVLLAGMVLLFLRIRGLHHPVPEEDGHHQEDIDRLRTIREDASSRLDNTRPLRDQMEAIRLGSRRR